MHVNLFEYKKTSNGGILTAHLGPCIGISIYNKKSKVGFLGHFISELDDSDSLFREAISKDVSDLEVFLTGGSISDEMNLEEVASVLNNREHLYGRLKKFGIPDYKIIMEFADRNIVTDMTLHTSNGFVEVNYENFRF
jgi:hypothetical protein